MNEKVTQMIALLFKDIQPSEEVRALHDEVLNNCQDRFADLTRHGLTEQEALAAVMESLKGMEDVLKDYPRRDESAAAGTKDAASAPAPDAPENQGPTLSHFNPEDIFAIRANLISCDVQVEASDGVFSLETQGAIHSRMEPGGVLYIWQEKPTDNLFKDIPWEKSFNSFESFGDVLGRLGQNLSQLVNRSFSLVGQDDCHVILRLPPSLHPEVSIRTTSGDISWHDAVPGKKFALGSTSGDIQVEIDRSFLLPQVNVSTTSGDAELRMSAHEARLDTVSGDLSWEGDAQSLQMNTTSGDADAIGQIQQLRMNSTSGDLDLRLTDDAAAEIAMKTISGDVDLHLPSSVGEIAANLNTRAGSLHTRGVEIVQDAAIRVDAHTISGDLKIQN